MDCDPWTWGRFISHPSINNHVEQGSSSRIARSCPPTVRTIRHVQPPPPDIPPAPRRTSSRHSLGLPDRPLSMSTPVEAMIRDETATPRYDRGQTPGADTNPSMPATSRPREGRTCPGDTQHSRTPTENPRTKATARPRPSAESHNARTRPPERVAPPPPAHARAVAPRNKPPAPASPTPPRV